MEVNITMKTLINRISFHIPGFKYIEGKMLNIYLDDFKAVLNKELEKVGVEAFYAEKAVGYYKGREYPQEIISVFFDKEDVLGCFARTVYSMRDSLNQEAYAYELNGKMYIYEAEEFYKLINR